MDARDEILGHLGEAERHVAEGECSIARQRQVILEMKQLGRDTSLSLELLATIEETQILHLEGFDRVRRQLKAFDNAQTESP